VVWERWGSQERIKSLWWAGRLLPMGWIVNRGGWARCGGVATSRTFCSSCKPVTTTRRALLHAFCPALHSQHETKTCTHVNTDHRHMQNLVSCCPQPVVHAKRHSVISERGALAGWKFNGLHRPLNPVRRSLQQIRVYAARARAVNDRPRRTACALDLNLS
jgi:hypothetical protein